MRPRASVDATASRLPAMAIPPNTRRSLPGRAASAAVLTAALIATACSTLPERAWPPRLVGEIEAVYHLPAGTGRTVPVPMSDERTTLLGLHTETQGVDELFVGGRRLWLVPDGVDELRIHCQYRSFGARGAEPFAAVLGPSDLFPGAEIVRHRAAAEPLIER